MTRSKHYGTMLADLLIGSDFGDEIKGYAGSDTIYGGAGNDIINAGSGHDHINSGLGNDTIYAGAGNDIITGSQQKPADRARFHNKVDTVFGGEGFDTFSILGPAYCRGRDNDYMLIADFNPLQDKLQLNRRVLYVLERVGNSTRVVLGGVDTVAVIEGLTLDNPFAVVGKDTYNDFWVNANLDWVTFA